MTFATDIAKPSSERYALVRLSPARGISGDLVLDSGNLYTMAFTGEPFEVVFRDEAPYTEDEDILINLTDKTWYYDRTSQTLYVNTTDNPTGIGSTSVSHYITLTDQQDIPLTIDPIAGGNTIIWQDRLKTPPKISASIANMVDGVVTTTSSSMSIENSDQAFNTWFGEKDSYHARAVDVWFSVDNTLVKTFRGVVQTIDITATTIVLGVVDKSTLFDDLAYMGSSRDDAVYSNTNHTVRTEDVGKISPFIVGESKVDTTNPGAFTRTKQSSGDSLPSYGIPTTGYEAICTSYSATTSSTTNRTWELCRGMQGNALTLDFGTVTSITSVGGVTSTSGEKLLYQGNNTPNLIVTVNSNGHNLRVGDTGVGYDNTLSVDAYFVVTEVTSTTSYRLAIIGASYTYPATDTTAGMVARYDMPTTSTAGSMVIVQNGTIKATPINGVDYDLVYTNLDNGTRRVEVVFVDNFEFAGGSSAHVDLGTISPDNCKIYFNYRTALETVHGTLVEQTMKGLDLTVNAASITAANDALTDGFTDGDCIMTIPPVGSSEHQTVRQVLAEILQSSIGYIRMDEDSEVYYELFDTPTGTKTRTDNDILSSSLVPRISYYDMYGKVHVDNKHVRAGDPLHLTTYELSEAQWLHKATKEKNLKTVFDRIPIPMSARYTTFFGAPRVTYKWSTMSLDLDTQLGDFVTLEATNLLGDITTVDVLVTKTIKSTQGVSVTGLVVV